jgi:ABC-type nitrate/sulfonate/bicarbonate transport system substrate-binding protein
MDRRSFLRAGLGAVGVAAASPLLAACGGGSSSSTTSSGLTTISYQLSWIKNFQFGGDYIADSKGYYKAQGLKVNLLAGGPNTAVDPIVQSGKALIGQSSPDFTANAVAKGADLKIIGANYQKSPFCIMSRADKPIRTPADLAGKKIGIQAANEVAWGAFLKLAKVDPSSFTKVPVQFDITPVISGDVDGFWAYVNDDVINMREKGADPVVMLLADFGYDVMTATYTVRSDSLTDKAKRAQIVSFLKGDLKGWQDAVADPGLVADLTVNTYGKGNGLKVDEQKACATATNEIMVTDETKAHGLSTMSDTLISGTIKSLAAAGITANPDLFDTSVLDEIFNGSATVS